MILIKKQRFYWSISCWLLRPFTEPLLKNVMAAVNHIFRQNTLNWPSDGINQCNSTMEPCQCTPVDVLQAMILFVGPDPEVLRYISY